MIFMIRNTILREKILISDYIYYFVRKKLKYILSVTYDEI